MKNHESELTQVIQKLTISNKTTNITTKSPNLFGYDDIMTSINQFFVIIALVKTLILSIWNDFSAHSVAFRI
jgi:hypothetical protein